MASYGLRARRFVAGLVLPVFVYLLLAIAYTWPLAISLGSRLGAPEALGDPSLNLWALGWDLRVLFSDPQALLDGRVFNAPIFHPAQQALAFSDHLIPQALLVAPVYAISGNLVLCYNLLLLASLAGSALAMYAFAKEVTGSSWGALGAGTVWGFWPYHVSHLIHPALQATYGIPLAFLFLHRVVAGRRRWDAVGLGAMTALTTACSAYYGVIALVGLGVSAVALVATTGARKLGMLLRRFVLAGVVALLLVAPFVWPYWQVQRREGFVRNLFEASRHAATPSSYVRVPSVNFVHGSGWLPEARSVEDALFVGITALVLAAIGFIVGRRQQGRPLALSMLALIVTGVVLSLGPDGVRPVYAVLHRWVFGFQAIRAPARFGVLVAFGIAALAALGIRALRTAPPGSSESASGRLARVMPVAAALAVALLAVEYLNRPLTLAAAPPLQTGIGQWLARAPQQGAVAYLPFARDRENTPFMLQTLEHGRPIVNGYSGQRPAFYSAVADTLAGFPSVDALWTLDELGVRYVVTPDEVDVVRWPLLDRATLSDPVLGPRTKVYELPPRAELETRLGPAAAPLPPPAGLVPFGVGERATYAVTWDGAGSSLAAGLAAIEVQDPASGNPPEAYRNAIGSARYRLVATATTAPWLARFFEARDMFATWVDDGLEPLVHERRLNEGRRVVDRFVEYDRGSGVAIVASPSGHNRLRFRVPPSTRDALAALFYARTLSGEVGKSVQLPVNDLGRNYVLDLGEPSTEVVRWQGRDVETIRYSPRLIQRVATRQPPEIRVWLSRDDRQVPLVAEVRAAFGTVRLELETYRGGRRQTTPAGPSHDSATREDD